MKTLLFRVQIGNVGADVFLSFSSFIICYFLRPSYSEARTHYFVLSVLTVGLSIRKIDAALILGNRWNVYILSLVCAPNLFFGRKAKKNKVKTKQVSFWEIHLCIQMSIYFLLGAVPKFNQSEKKLAPALILYSCIYFLCFAVCLFLLISY